MFRVFLSFSPCLNIFGPQIFERHWVPPQGVPKEKDEEKRSVRIFFVPFLNSEAVSYKSLCPSVLDA